MNRPPNAERKVWGWTWPLELREEYGVFHLDIEAGSWCSIHRHAERVNQFILLSGLVDVVLYGSDDKPCDGIRHIQRMLPGETYVVDVGIWHRFEVRKSGLMLEVYWPKLPDQKVHIDDIDRFEVGGKVNANLHP